MKKAIIFAVIMAFAVPSYAASTTTWKQHKSKKYWTVKTKKLKSTFEVIRAIKKRESRKLGK